MCYISELYSRTETKYVRTLKHVAQYSPLISDEVRRIVVTSPPNTSIKQRVQHTQLPLSELPQFLTGSARFNVPVYTVWGACEDVQVLEKLRSGEYNIPNLHIIDEAHSRLLEVGGVKLRLLGLGGAVVMHKLFDNGEGRTTIAGGQGTMWTTFLQMGELVDTASRVYDPSETRVLVTHASPAREGILNQLAVHLKVDFSISAGLHFRYGSSYNEFSVNPTLDHYRGKLAASKSSFTDIWETVRSEVEPLVADSNSQQRLLQNALHFVEKMPAVATSGGPFGGSTGGPAGQVDEAAFKNMWNFNLADAAFGWLVLEIESGRIGTEMKAQGFNFSHRGTKQPGPPAEQAKSTPPIGAVAQPANTTPLSNPGAQPRVPPSGVATQGQPLQNRPTQPMQTQSQGNVSRGPPQAAPTQAAQQTQPKPTAPVPAQQPSPRAPAPASTPSTGFGSANQNQKPNPSVAPPAGANGANDKADQGKANGTAEDSPKDAQSPAPEKKPSQAIFIQGVNSEDEARNLFAEADRTKIQRIDTRNNYYVAHFENPEEMQKVFDAASPDHKKQGAKGKPHIKVYEQRTGGRFTGSFNRTTSGAPQGGYRSASDSEGGRGRGGFRGRGGRGGPRGGRGGPAGRGGFSKGAEGGTGASTTSGGSGGSGPPPSGQSGGTAPS